MTHTASLLALSPIAIILVLMVFAGRSAAISALAGLAVAVAVALGIFDFELRGMGGIVVEAVFIALTILWIIFPALSIHEMQTSSGAIARLRNALTGLSERPAVTAILVGWFFALFIEGAAGFGTPVALAAPILVASGFPPVQAVAMVLLGHAAGVSFGAVGTPVITQLRLVDIPALELAGRVGMLHAVLGSILLAFVVSVAHRSAPTRGGARGTIGWTALAAASFLIPSAALAHFVGPELPSLGGALIGGTIFVLALRLAGGTKTGGQGDGKRLILAAMPYLVLLAFILATRLIEPVRLALSDIQWEWALPGGYGGGVAPLYHPGTMLMMGLILGGLIQGRSGREIGLAMGQAARRLGPMVVALVTMLVLARLMVHSGMIETLANSAAISFGAAWPAMAPAVGVLGTFVTGSATASNILFTDFQEATALKLGLAASWLVAGQSFGAAIGNIICPHNIIAGAAVVGLIGREGEVLRHTLMPCLLYTALGGALVFLASVLF